MGLFSYEIIAQARSDRARIVGVVGRLLGLESAQARVASVIRYSRPQRTLPSAGVT